MKISRSSRFAALSATLVMPMLALAACSKAPSSETNEPGSGPPLADDMSQMNDPMANPAPDTDAANGLEADNLTAAVDRADNETDIASLTGDAAKGHAVFTACKTCHAIDKNLIGPMLKGVVGRKAGTVADFAYSPAMKNSGLTWTAQELSQFLEKPQAVVPGTRMTYPGLADPQKRADVIAYLKVN